MKLENQERIEAHKKLYEDLVQWVNNQFEAQIKVLFPTAKISVCEWYSSEPLNLIKGASVNIEIKGWFDSDTISYLCHVLGSKEFRVTAFPLCRMHLTFKVSLANTCKAAMTCSGTWIPKWKKEDEKKNK